MNIQKNMFSGEIITEIIAIKIIDKTAIKAGTYKFKAADNKLNRGQHFSNFTDKLAYYSLTSSSVI